VLKQTRSDNCFKEASRKNQRLSVKTSPGKAVNCLASRVGRDRKGEDYLTMVCLLEVLGYEPFDPFHGNCKPPTVSGKLLVPGRRKGILYDIDRDIHSEPQHLSDPLD